MLVLNIEFLLRSMAAPLLSAVFTLVPAHMDTSIKVLMNEAKIVRLTRAADTVIVGNPEIADATVQDSKTIVLTGKGFGTTNLIIIDRNGNEVVHEKVFVARNTDKTMRVYNESGVQTFFCSPACDGAYKSPAQQQSDQEINKSSL
jgi:Flp pilus assembly secretin CpaC